MGFVVVGCLLLIFQLDVEDEIGTGLTGGGGKRAADLPTGEMLFPRSRRETTDLAQLTARERRSLTCRFGEAYQRWNETEGQREAKLHQQRKRIAKQAKLQEEVSSFGGTQ